MAHGRDFSFAFPSKVNIWFEVSIPLKKMSQPSQNLGEKQNVNQTTYLGLWSLFDDPIQQKTLTTNLIRHFWTADGILQPVALPLPVQGRPEERNAHTRGCQVTLVTATENSLPLRILYHSKAFQTHGRGLANGLSQHQSFVGQTHLSIHGGILRINKNDCLDGEV